MSITEQVIRGKSRFLTLEYAFAAGAALLAVIVAVEGARACFVLWGGTLVNVRLPVSLLFNLSNGYAGAIVLGVAGVVLSLVAYLLFARVTRAIAERPAYTRRRAYKVTTYGALAVLLVMALLVGIELIAILLTSLLLISSESSIAGLYLDHFIPQLAALILISVIGYLYYKITIGQNTSRLLSQILLLASTIILLTLAITVAIRSHGGYSSNDYGRVQRGIDFDNFNQPSPDDWYWNN